MRIKIVSDGTFYGTKVVNAKTDEVLEGVKRVSWRIDSKDKRPVAELEVLFLEAEIETTAKLSKQILRLPPKKG